MNMPNILKIFFKPPGIAGRNFVDLLLADTDLGTDEINQVETVVELLHGTEEFMWECNQHVLVKEVTKRFDDQEKHLELTGTPFLLMMK